MIPKTTLTPPLDRLRDPRSLDEAVAILQEMARAVSPDDVGAAALSSSVWSTPQAEAEREPVVPLVPQKDFAHRSWSESTFEGLVESAADSLLICDRGGLVVLMNSQAEKMFGYRRDELLGQSIDLLVPGRFRAKHPQHRERFFSQPHPRPMGRGLELLGRRKDGTEFPVEISLSPLEAEGELLVTAAVRDVTDRKRLEARYVTLVEGIPAVTFMAALDETNNELYVSPQIEQLLGFSQAEWLGDPFLWYRQLHPDDRQRWGLEFARTCASGVRFKSEYRFISRDGREVWVHGEARVVRDERGRPLFLQGIAYDITESKRAEQLLRQSAEELEDKIRERTAALQEATLRAELASGARASFLANMSHEIRTPLNGIIGFADLLRRKADSNEKERDEWLEIVLNSGKHLLALINDVLDLSKIDAGKMQVEVVPCLPAKIINEVCSVLRAKANEKGLKLEAVFEGPIPQIIQSDPTRLRQILINIAGNAIKFTSQGSVLITTRLRRGPGQPMLVMEISDTGIGISPDKLESIFDPFTQADSSITRQFGGTGLGLAISRRLAEHLGGGISVESELRRGTTFTCEIATGPLSEQELSGDAATLTAHAARFAESTAEVDLAGCRVLVVDDGDTNRKLIRLLLGRAGALVEEAENGKQAVNRVNSEAFDVVLMDMQMPVMDGYAATRELRRQGIKIPIIALTANAMSGDDAVCREAGCSGYLPKPIDQHLLLSTVQGVLREQAVLPRSATPPSRPGVPPPTTPHRAAASNRPLVSLFPTDDPDFREIVQEFVQRLRARLIEMREAAAAHDFHGLAALAHWLKGTSGSAGFPDFYQPSEALERLADERRSELIEGTLNLIEEMATRIVIK